jgi:hypothetical protein
MSKEPNSNQVAGLSSVIQLVKIHLLESSRLPHLAAERAAQVTAGSIDLYNRLKARDSIDSIYCTAIVALLNAIIGSFENAPISSDRDEHLRRAYEGLALLTNLVEVRENLRALLNDADRREEVLNQLLSRYLSVQAKTE